MFRLSEIHRSCRAKILDHSQVAESLDRHGWSASKLWNVANYHSRRVWEETGEIPGHEELKDELKIHPKYKRLHSQSSQRILEELAEAFNSWYSSEDDRDNPSGYRKRNYHDDQGRRVHEEHPRSTVTWKQNGIRHDIKNNRVRLSKGANHKERPKHGNTSLSNTRRAPASRLRTSNRFVSSTTNRRGGGNCISSTQTKSRRPPLPALRQRVSTSVSAASTMSSTASKTPTSTLATASNRTVTTSRKKPPSATIAVETGPRLRHKWSERRTHFFHSPAKQCPSVTRARRVGCAVGKTTVSSLSGSCTPAKTVMRRSTLM